MDTHFIVFFNATSHVHDQFVAQLYHKGQRWSLTINVTTAIQAGLHISSLQKSEETNTQKVTARLEKGFLCLKTNMLSWCAIFLIHFISELLTLFFSTTVLSKIPLVTRTSCLVATIIMEFKLKGKPVKSLLVLHSIYDRLYG